MFCHTDFTFSSLWNAAHFIFDILNSLVFLHLPLKKSWPLLIFCLFQLLIDPSFILSIQTFWAFIRLVLFCIGLLLYDATFSFFFSVEFFHFNHLNLIFNHSEFLLILSAFVLFSHLISSIIYVSNILNIYFGIKCNFFSFSPPLYLYFLNWWFLFLIYLIELLY